MSNSSRYRAFTINGTSDSVSKGMPVMHSSISEEMRSVQRARVSLDVNSQLQMLQERVSSLESLLKIEQRKSALYEQEIEQLNTSKQGSDGMPRAGNLRRVSGVPRSESTSSLLSLAEPQCNSDESYVTISRKEYELLLLKDKAMGVLQGGSSVQNITLDL